MQRYQYLIYSLIFFCLFLWAIRTRKDLQKYILFPLILGAIAGPLSELIYFRDYWHPDTLVGKGVPSIEDILFGVAIVGLSLVFYPIISRRKEVASKHHLKVALLLIGVGVVMLAILLALGLNSVIATSVVFAILWVTILMIRKSITKPSLATACGMTAFAAAVYFVLLNFFFKEWLNQVWLLNDTNLGVLLPGHIPLTELIWFFTTTGFLDALDMYAYGFRFRKTKRSKKK